MPEKICPMNFNDPTGENFLRCKEHECAWWVAIRNTENHIENMCALAAIAIKNSEGKIPV